MSTRTSVWVQKASSGRWVVYRRDNDGEPTIIHENLYKRGARAFARNFMWTEFGDSPPWEQEA